MSEVARREILNTEQVREIREGAEKATPGTWSAAVNEFGRFCYVTDASDDFVADTLSADFEDDAFFIAEARQNVPALCDSVELLRADRDALAHLVERFASAAEEIRGFYGIEDFDKECAAQYGDAQDALTFLAAEAREVLAVHGSGEEPA